MKLPSEYPTNEGMIGEENMALEEHWRQLLEGNVRATPFSRPQWLLPTIDSNSPLLLSTPHGFGPFFLASRNTTRTIRLHGADYEDIIAQPGYEEEAIGELLAQLIQISPKWDICDFRTLLPNSVIMCLFENGSGKFILRKPFQLLLKDFSVEVIDHTVHQIVEIPKTWAEYESHLGKKLAYQMRSAETRRNKYFTSSCLRVASKQTLTDDVNALIGLHQSRWATNGGGLFASQTQQEIIHRQCDEFLSIDKLRLYTLWIDEKPAAALFTLADENRIYFYASGFDDTFKAHHPTKVLIAEAIKQAMTQGPKIFDFMKGGESYKQDWSTGVEQTYRVVIAKKTLRGQIALKALKLQASYRQKRLN